MQGCSADAALGQFPVVSTAAPGGPAAAVRQRCFIKAAVSTSRKLPTNNPVLQVTWYHATRCTLQQRAMRCSLLLCAC